MNLDELRAGLAEQERFTPDLDAVLERVRAAREPQHHRRAYSTMLRRSMPVAASIAAVGLLALVITIVHGRSQPHDVAAAPTVTFDGTHWKLSAATVAGMPNYGVQPDLTESLYLYPDGTSVTTGFCFTREGNWAQRGSELVFTNQRTLPQKCLIQAQDTAPRRALITLDGPMQFSGDAAVLHLQNSTTNMTLKSAGTAQSKPGPLTGAPVDDSARGLTDVPWQLTAAVQNGKAVALPANKITTIELYSDGTSNMVGPACFYQTGRWHTTGDRIELTDQVRPLRHCYLITDPKEGAGGEVLTAMTGPIQATINGATLTLKSGSVVATFTKGNEAAVDTTPASAPTSSR